MDFEKILSWMHAVIDNEKPEWFLLPYDIVDKLSRCDAFDLERNPEIVGGTGLVGSLRTAPVRMGYNMAPCYGKKFKVFWYKE